MLWLSMKTKKERILKYSVNGNIMEVYNAHKDFFISYIKYYALEAALLNCLLTIIYSLPAVARNRVCQPGTREVKLYVRV